MEASRFRPKRLASPPALRSLLCGQQRCPWLTDALCTLSSRWLKPQSCLLQPPAAQVAEPSPRSWLIGSSGWVMAASPVLRKAGNDVGILESFNNDLDWGDFPVGPGEFQLTKRLLYSCSSKSGNPVPCVCVWWFSLTSQFNWTGFPY